ncbi:MAG TPA: FGGY-family carbohydrate kinase [Armatimonadaceae bacterium]|nr:FGGY-family carbohydrate kinase [Armatimonadaceae bacterium]
MEQQYVVGVDVGTGSARAGIFSLTGERLGMDVRPIKMWRPRPEYAEQSSEDIWEAVGAAVREALAKSGVGPEAVVGIGFDATCSLVVLGEGDRPVTVSPDGSDAQNVVVWMDHRATAEADEINAGGYDVLKYVGGKISPEMEPPKMLWLKRHLPESWGRARKLLDLADFLTYRATGRDVRSLCTNVCKWAFLGHEGRWDRAFYDAIGIGDALDGARIADGDHIRPLGERIGSLTAESAAHLGLTTACQVAVGIIDAHAGGLGLLGAAWEGGDSTDLAALESVIALIGGTSNCHMAASREPIFVPGVWGPYYGAMVPGAWLTEGGQSAAGALIDHVIEDSSEYRDLAYQAEKNGTTVYSVLNEHVADLASQAGLSDPAYLTRDLHVLDYHLGNRSPHADPHARGVVDGLPLDESRDFDALLYLATVQAIAYGTREIIEALNARGFRISRIVATGGGTKNPLWLRQHADATGMEIVLGREPESVLLGSAILGGHASGAYESVTAAMKAMGRSGEVVSPNPAARAYHDAKYAVYRALYEEQNRHREIMRQV